MRPAPGQPPTHAFRDGGGDLARRPGMGAGGTWRPGYARGLAGSAFRPATDRPALLRGDGPGGSRRLRAR